MLDYQTPSGWCGDPSRGASMGRVSDLAEDTTAVLHVRRVPIDSGGYDPGGAYWGTPDDLFCVWDDDGHVRYLRTANMDAARITFPCATWAPETGPSEADLADMLDAYMTAALFTSNDESDDNGGDPLDDNYCTSDIADETRAKMRADVERFARENAATLLACIGKRGPYGKRECDWSQAGHDLWMTSQGHGVGFWDGDWPETEGKALSKASTHFGDVCLYVGDDGKIYA